MTEKKKVSGVILIDKPKGMTSQQVVSKVKYLFQSNKHNSKKAGHTGTLDPMATGLLPVCMGEATKFSHYQLDADKSYCAIVQLGIQTDTGDAEGVQIATRAVPIITEQILQQIQQKFTGNIEQIPPMYSALKKDGKKLYEYAREGQEVHRDARPVTIKSLYVSMITSQQLKLEVTCSKGTYIRVLGEDIAGSLGTVGHLIELRRTTVGNFSVNEAVSLQALSDMVFNKRLDSLLPIYSCLPNTPNMLLGDEQVDRIRMGQRLNVKDQLIAEGLENIISLSETGIDVCIFNKDKLFIGLVTIDINGRLQPKKLIQY